MIPTSLRTRLIILLVSTVFLTATLAGAFGVIALQIDLQEKFDRNILNELSNEIVEPATELIFSSIRFEDLPRGNELHTKLNHEGDEYALRISDTDGATLFSSQFFNDPDFVESLSTPTPSKFIEAANSHGATVRFFSLLVRDPQTGETLGKIQVGRAIDQIAKAVSDEFWITGIGVLIATFMAILFGSFTASHILAPVKKITATAEELSVKNLKKRIRHRGPASDELTILARTLDRMLDRLATSVKNLKNFTSDASHELRTPLAALTTTIDVALAGSSPAGYKHALRESKTEVARLTRLVENLLTLARADSATLTIQKKELNLAPLLETIVKNLSPTAAERRITIETTDLPQPLTLTGDQDKLHQLFLNLFTNALKFNRKGGKIKITAKTTTKNIQINIQDTGRGIAKKDLKNIFRRFYQVDGSRTEAGSGLGLAICSKIAAAHGGKVTVKSKLKQGSTFTVHLPRK